MVDISYAGGTPLPHGWALVQPLKLTVQEDSPGWYVSSNDALDLYGEGTTEQAAAADYLSRLVADYRFWEREQSDGAINAPAQLAALKECVCPPLREAPHG